MGMSGTRSQFRDFYPRPPRGGRPWSLRDPSGSLRFLSTPSARRATHPISGGGTTSPNFYPRPPRGGRLGSFPGPEVGGQFLSTPSARRATYTQSITFAFMRISIHALREEGDGHDRQEQAADGISIHALREEGDGQAANSTGILSEFLSTPSARRATVRGILPESYELISIHALREEGDQPQTPGRPPCQ